MLSVSERPPASVGVPPAQASNVVVRYADGRLLKGHTFDFDPNKPCFHLHQAGDPTADGREVWIRELKAVFFVKDFSGQPDYTERKDFGDGHTPPAARKMRVEFADGEVFAGYTMGYHPQRQGFFFFPVDSGSNNLRVFAVLATIRKIERA